MGAEGHRHSRSVTREADGKRGFGAAVCEAGCWVGGQEVEFKRKNRAKRFQKWVECTHSLEIQCEYWECGLVCSAGLDQIKEIFQFYVKASAKVASRMMLSMPGIPGLLFLLLLLLCVVGQGSSYEASWKPTWPAYRLPVVLPQSTLNLAKPDFGAEAKLEVSSSCGPQCHKGTPLPTYEEAKQYLSYETLYADGSLTETQVGIYILSDGRRGAQNRDSELSRTSRRKRQIYGYDSRFSIFGKDFLLNYPFSTSVKLSTGCTGTLVAEKHVLTAAHCIHDGKTYVKGTQKLRVGFLKSKFKDGGRETNTSSSATPEKMKFQWIRVKRTHVPKGWIKGNANDIGMDYDYALLELKKPHKRKFMKIGVSPPAKQLPGGRIHFSGYDNDRPGNLVYRFCDVKDETYDLLYQQCDAQPGASGSGVYVRMWKRQQQKWERKIIGIFSGHQWVDMNGSPQDFNVAVRITPLKYAQICYWIKGNYLDCREG
ncbi:Serine protease 23 [Fukomys damarensis]|uniref:Serine protease 23 n=2 Tax=Fukomys damarensis TaxID=885580 RepID=A0A091DG77_FUKDA|nr:Serine protease 23 [Fukomys damarensis]